MTLGGSGVADTDRPRRLARCYAFRVTVSV